MIWQVRGIARVRFPLEVGFRIEELDDEVIEKVEAMRINWSSYAFLTVHGTDGGIVNAAKLLGGIAFHLLHCINVERDNSFLFS